MFRTNQIVIISILLSFLYSITPPFEGRIPQKHQKYFKENRIGKDYEISSWHKKLLNSQLNRSSSVDSFFVPVILGNYKNEKGTINTQTYWEHIFGNNPSGSFSEYYFEVSNQKLYPLGKVFGWYDVDHLKSEAVENPRSFVLSVLGEADNDIDFGLYDNDGLDNIPNSGDDDGFVDGVIIIYPGNTPAVSDEYGGDNENIWPHKWVLNGTYEFVSNDISSNGGYIKLFDYTLCPEKLNNNIHPIGTLTHEFGHILGLPDLYDTTNEEVEPNHDFHYGIGTWGLMAYGTWLGYFGSRPSHLSGWAKNKLGWVNTTRISLGNYSLPPVESSSLIMKMIIPDNSTEYFLFENRQKIGFDDYLKGEGMLIYHVDENQTNNQEKIHKKVDLEESDGRDDLDNKFNWGDDGDPYPGSSNNIIFSNYSYPNSKSYDFISSNYKIINISEDGENISFLVSEADYSPGCNKGFVDINGSNYCQDDLDVLQEFIDNSQNGEYPPPINLNPIELGSQTWSDGRLTFLNVRSKAIYNQNNSGSYFVDYMLSGEFPESIGNLTEIKYLSLRAHSFTGEIPNSIGSLNKLEYLLLNSKLSGDIPENIGNLIKLRALELSCQYLTGSIPNSILNLTNLTRLSLNNNQLTGGIPNQIDNLIQLNTLNLSYNNLNGEIPKSIGEILSLENLNLSSNNLNGEIPIEFEKLNNLTSLSLKNNQLSGVVPINVFQFPQLDFLYLSNNQLSGILPENICTITNTEVGNNLFCPPYPNCLINIPNITSYSGWDSIKSKEFEFCYGSETISEILEGKTKFKLEDYYGENQFYTPKVLAIELSSSW